MNKIHDMLNVENIMNKVIKLMVNENKTYRKPVFDNLSKDDITDIENLISEEITKIKRGISSCTDKIILINYTYDLHQKYLRKRDSLMQKNITLDILRDHYINDVLSSTLLDINSQIHKL